MTEFHEHIVETYVPKVPFDVILGKKVEEAASEKVEEAASIKVARMMKGDDNVAVEVAHTLADLWKLNKEDD